MSTAIGPIAFVIACLTACLQGQCATQWLPGDGLPGTYGPTHAATMWDPDGAGPKAPVVVLGGGFEIAGRSAAHNIVTYDPATGIWAPLGSGLDGDVFALTTLPNGDLVAGGGFLTAGSVTVNHIARFDGSTWSSLGSGPAAGPLGLSSTVLALFPLANGDVVAAGFFATAGAASSDNIARWNGATWSALCTGLNSAVTCLVALPDGTLVAGGSFTMAGGVSANGIARWDGSNWTALGAGVSGGSVHALAILPNGDLVACGSFTMAGAVAASRIARWDGTAWSPLGVGLSVGLGGGTSAWALALAAMPDGDLVVGGNFTMAGGMPANCIARWDGSNWSPLGLGTNRSVVSLATLPNGDLVAGGAFTMAGGNPADYLARWNGGSWSPLGGQMDDWVLTLASLPNGNLAVGGAFVVVDDEVTAYVAQLATTCPATAESYGMGCVGAGGVNQLIAASLPWAGSTFRAAASGLASNGLALGVYGFGTASIGLPAILPQGLPGCELLVQPDLLALHVPQAGSLTTQLVIPNSLALANVVLHQQIAALELDGLGSITAVTSSNALTLTIGVF